VLGERQIHGVGQRRVVEPCCDLCVVRGDACEGVARETAFRHRADRAVGTKLLEHNRVVGRIDDHGDELVVLGGCAHHRRTPDVDQFDARVTGKRIQVAHHEIDRLDPVLGHVGLMRGLGGIGQQSAVNLRVEGDDSVVEDRRHPGELGEVGDRRAGS
jgi:hypothetical protein